MLLLLNPDLSPTFARFLVSNPLAQHPWRQSCAQNLKQGSLGLLGAPVDELPPPPGKGPLQNEFPNGLQLLPGHPGRRFRALCHHQARMEPLPHGNPHQVTRLNGFSGVTGVGEQQGPLANLHQHVQPDGGIR